MARVIVVLAADLQSSRLNVGLSGYILHIAHFLVFHNDFFHQIHKEFFRVHVGRRFESWKRLFLGRKVDQVLA
jgi:uncharacterized short protein YbdD (DUF466 family)